MHPSAPHVRLSVHDGTTVRLGSGDLIGRAASAALVLDDPSASEAHAMVSLRRGRFVMLALRRLLLVRGKPTGEIELRPGLEVQLTDATVLRIRDVALPTHVLGLEAPGLGVRRVGSVASLKGGPSPTMWGRFEPHADAHLWAAGEGWRLRIGDSPPRSIEAGESFSVDGVTFAAVSLPLGQGLPATGSAPTADPLRLVTYFDGAEIHREGQPVVTIGGLGARILSELAAFGGPVPWATVAGEVWPREDEAPCRHRWDMALSRLRRKLSRVGVRPDLIRADGNGLFQLVLLPEDELEDCA